MERTTFEINNLGDLMIALVSVPADTKVHSIAGFGIGGPHSYRGYYEDLALEPQGSDILTAKALLEELYAVLDTEQTGWKGGEYLMTETTQVWIAYEGCTAGHNGGLISGAEYIDDVLLITPTPED